MKKDKDFLPKDIKDLEDIFYKESKIEDRKRYESFVQNYLSDWQEKEIETIFGKFGKCDKIEETPDHKTFDFKIDDVKLLIEGASINLSPGENIINANNNHLISKIRSAVRHIENKESSQFPQYLRGGVVHCSSVLTLLTDLWSLLKSPKICELIVNSKVDYVAFIPESASVGGKNSRELYPPIVFVKDKHLAQLLIEKLPKNYQIIGI